MSGTAWRILGALLVAASGALLGHRARSALRERERLLRRIAAGLGRMADELSLLCRPLPDIFEHLADLPFFSTLRSAGEGERISVLWRCAALAQPLPESDREILAALAEVVGRYDADRQASELTLARRRLTERADALAEKLDRSGRQYVLLGAAAGAMLAVLLL